MSGTQLALGWRDYRERGAGLLNAWFLWAAAATIVIPTFYRLGVDLWSTEDGAHGPLVLASGAWAFYRARDRIAAVATRGNAVLAGILLGGSLLVFIFGNITGWLGLKCLGMYGAALAIYYYHLGFGAVRKMWFPLIYLLFMFPFPELITIPLTQALKLSLSAAAVDLLSALGYRIGAGGVDIYIDQYDLLLETACSGMNSLIGLSAICLLYCYLHYEGRWRQSLPLLLAIAPIAIFSNFIRLLVLILVTHYFGDRVAQKFVHDVAAILLFVVALSLLLLADIAFSRLRASRLRAPQQRKGLET
jgi:exosortase